MGEAGMYEVGGAANREARRVGEGDAMGGGTDAGDEERCASIRHDNTTDDQILKNSVDCDWWWRGAQQGAQA